MIKTREQHFEEAQVAFEVSDFYFRGESPSDRIISWHVWIRAWMTAVGEQPPPIRGRVESIS